MKIGDKVRLVKQTPRNAIGEPYEFVGTFDGRCVKQKDDFGRDYGGYIMDEKSNDYWDKIEILIEPKREIIR